MAITKITTHVNDARKRLLEQYKNKPHVEGTLEAINNQVQEIENTGWDLKENRSLDTATGVQLDGIGEIVNLERPTGMSDTEYRIRLKAQIQILISNGEPETIIRIFQLLSGATSIHLIELELASYGIGSEVSFTKEQLDILVGLLEDASVGGARVEEIYTYDSVNPFTLGGDFAYGGGFGDTGDPSKGGKFGTLYPLAEDFTFSDITGYQTHSGFGDLADNRTGQRLSSL